MTTDPCAEYVAWLKARAESYGNDGRVLAEDGDEPMAVAYKTIASELRAAVQRIPPGPAESAWLRPSPLGRASHRCRTDRREAS